MHGILEHFSHPYVFADKHKKNHHAVKALLLLLLDFYPPVR